MPSLLEAIESKYFQSDDSGPPDGSFIIFAPKICARDCMPRILVLDKCEVNSAGDEGQLAKLCSNVQELDLSYNDLISWNDVTKILRHTPSAIFVNLSFNQLSLPLERSLLVSFPHLQSLVLNGTNIRWETLWILLDFAVNLKDVHLSKNSYECVDFSPVVEENSKFSCVNKLMFDGNPISNWEEISKLGRIFPDLKQLSLSDCPLRSIPEDAFENFLNLETLNISNTLLQTSEDIMQLNQFPALSEIRTSGVQFLDDLPVKERRQELMALLPKICKLNGGANITQEERDASERYYIRKYLNKTEKSIRYLELIEKHGTLDPLAEVKLKPVTKVTLRIKFEELEIDQKVNLCQSVRSFKKFLEPVCGIESDNMVLYHNDLGINFGKDVLRFPDKQLYTYNMHEGDEIYVEFKSSSSQNSYVKFVEPRSVGDDHL